jgi:hypothetical protein
VRPLGASPVGAYPRADACAEPVAPRRALCRRCLRLEAARTAPVRPLGASPVGACPRAGACAEPAAPRRALCHRCLRLEAARAAPVRPLGTSPVGACPRAGACAEPAGASCSPRALAGTSSGRARIGQATVDVCPTCRCGVGPFSNRARAFAFTEVETSACTRIGVELSRAFVMRRESHRVGSLFDLGKSWVVKCAL